MEAGEFNTSCAINRHIFPGGVSRIHKLIEVFFGRHAPIVTTIIVCRIVREFQQGLAIICSVVRKIRR